jgi:signal transduction histidine kinase
MACGAFLLASTAVRSLAGARQVPLWVFTMWAALDMAVWFPSFAETNYNAPLLYTGLMLAADAALIGWQKRRGLYHFLTAALFVASTPLLAGYSPDRHFLVDWLLLLIPGSGFTYLLLYTATRMTEERASAALAQAEAERARRTAELANSHLREYAQQVEGLAVLRERQRLARDVHDTIAHGFTSILMQISLIERLKERDPAEALALLDQIKAQVRDSLGDVRRSVHALRPLEIDETGGIGGLARLVDKYAAATGVRSDLVVTGQACALPSAHELCLYRAAQEGLTNAFRHGHATQARVRLTFLPGLVTLAIEDDGHGSAGPVTGGLGIVGIRERVGVLGGIVAAGNSETGGFVLRLHLPLAPQEGIA